MKLTTTNKILIQVHVLSLEKGDLALL